MFRSSTPSAFIQTFFEPTSSTLSHVLSCKTTKKAAIIDSVLEYDLSSGQTDHQSISAMTSHIQKEQLHVEWILETHVHADHITGAPLLKKIYPNAKVAISSQIEQVYTTFAPFFSFDTDFHAHKSLFFDHFFKEDESFKVGDLNMTALSTPGHTPGILLLFPFNTFSPF